MNRILPVKPYFDRQYALPAVLPPFISLCRSPKINFGAVYFVDAGSLNPHQAFGLLGPWRLRRFSLGRAALCVRGENTIQSAVNLGAVDPIAHIFGGSVIPRLKGSK